MNARLCIEACFLPCCVQGEQELLADDRSWSGKAASCTKSTGADCTVLCAGTAEVISAGGGCCHRAASKPSVK
jgi:hypothetical protein